MERMDLKKKEFGVITNKNTNDLQKRHNSRDGTGKHLKLITTVGAAKGAPPSMGREGELGRYREGDF